MSGSPGLPVALLAAHLAAVPSSAQIVFTDVSAAVGVDGDVYSSGGHHGLGVNWIDFDGDGWSDLFAVGGRPGHPPHLFRNEGDGTFSRADVLLGALPDVEMSGSRFADVDGDGDPDLFVYTDNDDLLIAGANLPDGPPNLLLLNLWVENGHAIVPGEALFVDVAAAAGVDDLAPAPLGDLPAYRSKTATFFDYDRDGCVDLFVGHMVINSAGQEVNKDRLYRNLCGGPSAAPAFEDVTAASGLYAAADPSSYRAALASAGFHLDGDLWPELYVVNVSYGDPQPLLNDQIYRNGLPAGPAFTEVAGTLPGVGDDAQAGMGLDVADVDLDGDWDVFITDFFNTSLDEAPRGNVLYLGDGMGGFSDNAAAAAGVEACFSSWGVNFFDADHDGREDLYVADQLELFYRNDGTDGEGRPSFTNVAAAAGLATGNSRGSAVADFDRDGDLDFAVVNEGGGLQLFRNDTVPAPGAGHWLVLELEGGASNRSALGAVVEATAGGVVRRRQVKGGSSAHSQDALAVHFGLGGAASVDELRVRWPSGDETVLTNVAADRYLRVVEALFRDGFEAGDATAWSAAAP